MLFDKVFRLKNEVVPKVAEPVAIGDHPPVVPSFMELMEESLKRADASPRSLVYTLRFYRRVAGGLGINGSKPEDVAVALLNRIEGNKDG